MNDNVIIFLHLAILGFWVLTALKNIIFWTYVWQIKEYRLDRMMAYFELPSSRATILNARFLLSLALLCMSVVMVLWQGFWFIDWPLSVAILAFYVLMLLRFFEQVRRKETHYPQITSRAAMVLVVSALVHLGIVAAVLQFDNTYLLVALVTIDFLAPVLCSIGVVVSTPIARIMKRRILEGARRKREQMKGLLVVGITGSYGKTSTKEFIVALLSERFKVLTTVANNNTEMSVARTILNDLNDSYDIFVAEMGAYKKGEIATTASIAQPTIGVLTGIGPQHLSLFGSMQNTQKAKYELIEALPEKGLAVFNGDNDIVKDLFYQCEKPKRLYASNAFVDKNAPGVRAESTKYINKGTEIKVREGQKQKTETITTDLLGKHNVSNLMGAITVAREVGMSFDEIRQGIKKIESIEHTLKPLYGLNESLVIDDSYSGNMHGVFAALDVLQRMQGKQKIMIFLPLIELGSIAEKAHKDIGAKIGEVCDACIVVSQDYFPILYEEAVKHGMHKDKMLCITKPDQVVQHIKEMVQKQDIILLENRINPSITQGLLAKKNGNGSEKSKDKKNQNATKDQKNKKDKKRK